MLMPFVSRTDMFDAADSMRSGEAVFVVAGGGVPRSGGCDCRHGSATEGGTSNTTLHPPRQHTAPQNLITMPGEVKVKRSSEIASPSGPQSDGMERIPAIVDMSDQICGTGGCLEPVNTYNSHC
jgi:hypothetical protein